MEDKRRVQAFSTKSRPGAAIRIKDLNVWKFFDPYSPWVLVHEGSLMGIFDFVPKYLRVGPWTNISKIYVAIIVAKLIYWMPRRESFELDDDILSVHPTAFSKFWLYNTIIFVWMKLVLAATLKLRGPGVVVTYTIQSWIILMARHGLSSLAPFLPKGHLLLWINELLRFPALATASITFFYWNFIIAPVIYYNLQTPLRKQEFVKFNLNFRMVQVHFFNIIFATMNTIVTSSRTFHYVDLWCGLAGVVCYALMYLFVLDRLGVHLYPIFSPRTVWSALSWSTLIGSYVGVYKLWNYIISTGVLKLQ